MYAADVQYMQRDNEIKTCGLVMEINMTIISTKFDHRGIWIIPGKTEGNQLEHVLITKKRDKIVYNMITYRDTNVNTDNCCKHLSR